MIWRRSGEMPADSSPSRTPFDELDAVSKSVGRKADGNKRNARTVTLFLAGSTAAIPVFIGLSGGSFVLGKVIPSTLAAAAALATSWVGIERPHERWNLYRKYHRTIQMEKLLYIHRVPPYHSEDRDRLLIEKLAQLQLALHDEWAGLLPRTGEVTSLGKAGR